MPSRAKTVFLEKIDLVFYLESIRWAFAVFGGAGMSRNEEKKHYFLRKKLKNNGFFSQKVPKISSKVF